MAGARVSTAQADLIALVDLAAKSKKRTILSRRGKDVAAVVPIEDLHRLEHLAQEEMDRIDLAQARAALTERGKRVALRDFLAESGDGV
jgi:prevent-host-death family protein